MAALPGVTTVAVTSRLPLEHHGINPEPLYPENDPSYANKLPPLSLFTTVGGDYFRAMRIPILAGKPFDRMDSQRDGEAIVSRSTARSFWKDSNGGRRPRQALSAISRQPLVYRDRRGRRRARHRPRRAFPHTVYFPEALQQDTSRFAQSERTMALVVRTAGGGASITPAVQKVVRSLDPTLASLRAGRCRRC